MGAPLASGGAASFQQSERETLAMAVHYDFGGRVAVVTGASKGIGRRIAERLRAAGAEVWAWDIAPVPIDGVRFLKVDIRDRMAIRDALSEVAKDRTSLDILVNSVGLLGGYRPFEQHGSEDWTQIVEVNLIAVMAVCAQALPFLRRARSGRIVNMGSLAGKDGLANMPVYSAASAGVIAFTKALGRELAGTEIRANCVTPGPIETDLILDLGQETVERLIAMSPMKRLGTTDEVAELVLWLCSDACSFSTGAVFDISGGRAAY